MELWQAFLFAIAGGAIGATLVAVVISLFLINRRED